MKTHELNELNALIPELTTNPHVALDLSGCSHHQMAEFERNWLYYIFQLTKVAVNLLSDDYPTFPFPHEIAAGAPLISLKNIAGNNLYSAIGSAYHRYIEINTPPLPLKLNPLTELLIDMLTEREDLCSLARISITNNTDILGYDRVLFNLSLRDELIRFIKDFRNWADSPDIERAIHKRQLAAKRNFDSLRKYVKWLFEHYAKILVHRLDLSYRAQYCQHLTLDQVLADRQRYFRLIERQVAFTNMLGHAWKLEYAMTKGFHFHCFFFFNGREVRQDVIIGQALGEMWNEVTNGQGMYWNANRNKSSYPKLGIGMIDHTDSEKRANLEQHALTYLTKMDLFVRLIAGNRRTFGKSAMKAKQHRKLGRPRIHRAYLHGLDAAHPQDVRTGYGSPVTGYGVAA